MGRDKGGVVRVREGDSGKGGGRGYCYFGGNQCLILSTDGLTVPMFNVIKLLLLLLDCYLF